MHKYCVPSVQGFFRSIALSHQNSLQDTLRWVVPYEGICYCWLKNLTYLYIQEISLKWPKHTYECHCTACFVVRFKWIFSENSRFIFNSSNFSNIYILLTLCIVNFHSNLILCVLKSDRKQSSCTWWIFLGDRFACFQILLYILFCVNCSITLCFILNKI